MIRPPRSPRRCRHRLLPRRSTPPGTEESATDIASTPGRQDELAAWFRLTLTDGAGSREIRALLATFGLPPAIFDASFEHLRRIVAEPLAQRLAARIDPAVGREVERAMAWLDAGPGHALITLADPGYPASLLEIDDPPPVLYCRGRRELLGRTTLAIVGSRNATRQGEENATQFAAYLAGGGWTIASGFFCRA